MATTQTEEGLRVTKHSPQPPIMSFRLPSELRTPRTRNGVPEHYVVTGSTGPTTPEDKDLYMGLRYGYEDEVEEVKEGWFANRTLGCFPGTPRTTYASEYGPIRWASVDNQFFAMIAIPEKPAPALVTQQKALPAPSVETLQKHPNANPNPKAYLNAFVCQPPPGANENVEYQYCSRPQGIQHPRSPRKTNQRRCGCRDGLHGIFRRFCHRTPAGDEQARRLGFELRLGHCRDNRHYQDPILASNSGEHAVHEAHVGPPAPDEGYSGQIQGRPSKNEPQAHGVHAGKKVSPLGLPAYPSAIPVFFGFYSMLQSAIELRGASFLWTSDLSSQIPCSSFQDWKSIQFMASLMGAQLWQTSMTPPLLVGSCPAEDHEIHAIDVCLHFIQLFRILALLDGQNLLSIVQMKLIRNETGIAPLQPTNRRLHLRSPDWGQSYRKPNKKKNP